MQIYSYQLQFDLRTSIKSKAVEVITNTLSCNVQLNLKNWEGRVCLFAFGDAELRALVGANLQKIGSSSCRRGRPRCRNNFDAPEVN